MRTFDNVKKCFSNLFKKAKSVFFITYSSINTIDPKVSWTTHFGLEFAPTATRQYFLGPLYVNDLLKTSYKDVWMELLGFLKVKIVPRDMWDMIIEVI